MKTGRRGCGCGCLALLVTVLLGAAAAAAGVGAIFYLLKPMGDAGNDFVTALHDENYDAAYALLAPELQDQFGDSSGLRGLILEYQLKPQTWNLNSYSMNNNTGDIIGHTVLSDGDSVT